jgi:hypothetical protein
MADTPAEGGCGDDAAGGAGEGVAESTRELLDGCGTSAGEAGCSELADGGERSLEQPVGLHPYGIAGWVGDTELSGERDTELAEIREWMERCDNRTDELRLLGNGCLPATVELAFRTLIQELITNKS